MRGQAFRQQRQLRQYCHGCPDSKMADTRTGNSNISVQLAVAVSGFRFVWRCRRISGNAIIAFRSRKGIWGHHFFDWHNFPRHAPARAPQTTRGSNWGSGPQFYLEITAKLWWFEQNFIIFTLLTSHGWAFDWCNFSPPKLSPDCTKFGAPKLFERRSVSRNPNSWWMFLSSLI